MTAYLVDVNILLALSWPGHQFHGLVEQWFARNSSKGWATCPLVEAGFVRILSSPAFSSRAVTTKEAFEALEFNTRHPDHQFWPDDLPLAQARGNVRITVTGPQQVTDVYLLALAIHHGGKLATLDKRLGNLVGGQKERAHLEILLPNHRLT
jgi:toxin-antitoxin system PIN domain toxin